MNLTANRAGHFGLLALLAGFTLWFTASAWKADATLVNMILIGLLWIQPMRLKFREASSTA